MQAVPRIEKKCLYCDATFLWLATPIRVKKGWGKFCSLSCKAKFYVRINKPWKKLEGRKSWNNHKKEVTCDVCNKMVLVSPSARNYKSKFCSRTCKHRYMETLTGSLSHRWQGGKTSNNKRIRNSKRYANWRTAVFERDNYTCQCCGLRGVYLHADHIKPFAYYSELRFRLSNGRTLCIDCHKSTDTYLGKARRKEIVYAPI